MQRSCFSPNLQSLAYCLWDRDAAPQQAPGAPVGINLTSHGLLRTPVGTGSWISALLQQAEHGYWDTVG